MRPVPKSTVLGEAEAVVLLVLASGNSAGGSTIRDAASVVEVGSEVAIAKVALVGGSEVEDGIPDGMILDATEKERLDGRAVELDDADAPAVTRTVRVVLTTTMATVLSETETVGEEVTSFVTGAVVWADVEELVDGGCTVDGGVDDGDALPVFDDIVVINDSPESVSLLLEDWVPGSGDEVLLREIDCVLLLGVSVQRAVAGLLSDRKVLETSEEMFVTPAEGRRLWDVSPEVFDGPVDDLVGTESQIAFRIAFPSRPALSRSLTSTA